MDAVELTRELIKIESTDPGSWETRVGEYICNYLKEKWSRYRDLRSRAGKKNCKRRRERCESASGTGVYLSHGYGC